MSKKNPILHRSDLIEMYDRSKLFLYDLAQICADKDCRANITISTDGSISFELMEDCEDRYCYKTQYQSEGYLSYEEKTIKKD